MSFQLYVADPDHFWMYRHGSLPSAGLRVRLEVMIGGETTLTSLSDGRSWTLREYTELLNSFEPWKEAH